LRAYVHVEVCAWVDGHSCLHVDWVTANPRIAPRPSSLWGSPAENQSVTLKTQVSPGGLPLRNGLVGGTHSGDTNPANLQNRTRSTGDEQFFYHNQKKIRSRRIQSADYRTPMAIFGVGASGWSCPLPNSIIRLEETCGFLSVLDFPRPTTSPF